MSCEWTVVTSGAGFDLEECDKRITHYIYRLSNPFNILYVCEKHMQFNKDRILDLKIKRIKK